MSIQLPTAAETRIINQQRGEFAAATAASGRPDAPMMVMAGPCADDKNCLPGGRLASVTHLGNMAATGSRLPNIRFVGRKNGVKPRTSQGPTGLLHEPGGPETYIRGARDLTRAGIPIAAEIMDESDAAIAGPWLTAAWIGARNTYDTAPRYLVRPTSEELEAGMHPLPVFVKNSLDGSLDGVVNAIETIMSDSPRTRTRLTLGGGLRTVTTRANPHVGLILRGQTPRPQGPLDEILYEEVMAARERLDKEFGTNRVPIGVDVSHAHAKYEGGGEKGQLAVVAAIGNLVATGLPVDLIMAETYILAGNQPEGGTVPGLSTVDKCMDETNAFATLATMDSAWASRSLATALA